MSTQHTAATDKLAASIIRAQARGDAGTFSDVGRASRFSRIDGMCIAWEIVTDDTADEDTLQTAASRHINRSAR